MALIHLDAGVVIGFLDRDDAHHSAAREALSRALKDRDHLAMAASALAECLVGPARGGEHGINVVCDMVGRIPISIVPLDTEIAIAAARIRASHRSLRLPDALVIATAMQGQADRLVTTDHRWPTARALKVPMAIGRL